MKKLFFAAVIGASFSMVACGESTTAPKTDSLATAPADTAAKTLDTASKMVDSASKMVDTAKAKVDSAKK